MCQISYDYNSALVINVSVSDFGASFIVFEVAYPIGSDSIKVDFYDVHPVQFVVPPAKIWLRFVTNNYGTPPTLNWFHLSLQKMNLGQNMKNIYLKKYEEPVNYSLKELIVGQTYNFTADNKVTFSIFRDKEIHPFQSLALGGIQVVLIIISEDRSQSLANVFLYNVSQDSSYRLIYTAYFFTATIFGSYVMEKNLLLYVASYPGNVNSYVLAMDSSRINGYQFEGIYVIKDEFSTYFFNDPNSDTKFPELVIALSLQRTTQTGKEYFGGWLAENKIPDGITVMVYSGFPNETMDSSRLINQFTNYTRQLYLGGFAKTFIANRTKPAKQQWALVQTNLTFPIIYPDKGWISSQATRANFQYRPGDSELLNLPGRIPGGSLKNTFGSWI